MPYFRYFPQSFYKFGNEESTEIFPNISIYADIVDSIRDNVSFYSDYYIQENSRPDQVSSELYNTPQYHWTFYLMNPILRERGWPLSNQEILKKIQSDRRLTVITTRDSLNGIMLPYQIINGITSGTVGYVEYRNLDLGQLSIEITSGTSFIAGETIVSTNDNNEFQTIVVNSVSPEYLSAHHYENADGITVDIDPLVGPGAQLIEVSHLDRYIRMNEELKSIRVIKSEVIREVVQSFREAVSN